jgi:phosphate transport system permease protein
MDVLKQTLKAKRQEKIAKAIIWLFVLLTLGILLWILMYILVRGFFFYNRVKYPFTDIKETELSIKEYPGDKFIFIVNKDVRIQDLTIEELKELYTKKREANWGDYTGQNLKVSPFAFAGSSPFIEAATYFILGDKNEFSKYTSYVLSPGDMIEKVSKTSGSIGFIPADSIDAINNQDVKILPIRRICVLGHPSVFKIEDNIQIRSLDHEDLNNIFSGKVENWKEVGGIDLKIRPVVFSPDNIIPEILKEDTILTAQALLAKDPGDFFHLMETTEGAIGLCYYNDIADPAEYKLFDIERVEFGWNLTIHYLIEEPARSGKWGGISTIIINTLFLILFTLIFSVPVGVLGAIYFVEYAKASRLVLILRMGTETLAGIPSIVFGLFGFIFFVGILKLGIGFISATLTVTMMILPTVIRVSEEALKAVPITYREGSLALGATKLQTIIKVVVPAASPGILTGVILSIGRVAGETAVLIYTLGSNYELVRGPSSSARVLSLHLYSMFSEAISFDRCFATAAILIFIMLLVNYTTTRLISRLNRMAGKESRS